MCTSLDAALYLQISSVFVPNLVMFFAFWFWGVIEGEYCSGNNYVPNNITDEEASIDKSCHHSFVEQNKTEPRDVVTIRSSVLFFVFF